MQAVLYGITSIVWVCMGKEASQQTALPGVTALPQQVEEVAAMYLCCDLRHFWSPPWCIDVAGEMSLPRLFCKGRRASSCYVSENKHRIKPLCRPCMQYHRDEQKWQLSILAAICGVSGRVHLDVLAQRAEMSFARLFCMGYGETSITSNRSTGRVRSTPAIKGSCG